MEPKTRDGLTLTSFTADLDTMGNFPLLIWKDGGNFLTWSDSYLLGEPDAVVVARKTSLGSGWLFFEGISADVAMAMGWWSY